jgi:hypothetical protein
MALEVAVDSQDRILFCADNGGRLNKKGDQMLPPKSLSQQNVVHLSQNQPLIPLARQLVWILFILAIANGVFLFVFPHFAETHYAWPIKPPINAAFMGAGYLAGMVATGLVLFRAKLWRSVRVLFPAFFALGLSLFIATMLHADRFKWDYALTWVWTVIYFAIPIGSVVVWYLHEKNAEGLPSKDSRLNTTRVSSVLLGLIVTVLALMLFFTPQLFLETWPWQVSPLMARVFAGWYFLAGVILLFSFDLRQAHEIPVAFATLAAWGLLSLLVVIVYQASLRQGLGLWLWVVLHGLFLLQSAWATLKALSYMNQEAQRL